MSLFNMFEYSTLIFENQQNDANIILLKTLMCDFIFTTISGNGAYVQVTSSLSSVGDVFVLDKGD